MCMETRWGQLKTISKVASLLCLSLPRVYAAAGTTGASILDIPVGAEPAALGSAYSALAADAYAPVWNPAGLGWLEDTELGAQHLSYLESMNFEYASFVHPLKQGRSLGASIQYAGSNSIIGRDISGQETSNFDASFGAYSVAYGQRMSDRLSLGLSGKWVHVSLADVGANAFAADLGALYRV